MLLTLARDNSGRCVGLRLPAEPSDIAAAYEKLDAVCTDERQTRILRAETGVGSLDRWHRDRKVEQIDALGELAVKIDAMTEQERKTFDGALTGAAFESVDDVLRIADSLGDYILINGVTTEKELGRFLVDSGYKGFPRNFCGCAANGSSSPAGTSASQAITALPCAGSSSTTTPRRLISLAPISRPLFRFIFSYVCRLFN